MNLNEDQVKDLRLILNKFKELVKEEKDRNMRLARIAAIDLKAALPPLPKKESK